MTDVRHAYPHDLAAFVIEHWPDGDRPEAGVLERLCATSYHASLQRDEDRAITCRLLLADPATFSPDGGPPDELHCLRFAAPRAFTAREVRRLSAAADAARSLIGVWTDGDGGLHIWGLVYQGARWTHDVIGGRGGGPALPPVPVVGAMAPGSIEVRRGAELMGRLERGSVSMSRYDVFESQWLHDDFQGLQDDLNETHAAARALAAERGERWATPEPTLARLIGEQMMKRTISVARWRQRHGGMLVFLPGDGNVPYEHLLDIKYPFAPTDARKRFYELLDATLDRLGAHHGELGRDVVTWTDFRESTDEQLDALDEGLFGLANLLANLTSVDGAVVLDKHLEILGFGAEISGELPSVPEVDRALDPDGHAVVPEQSANEGTRHRSAYRLVAALPGALAIVISQDGGVRFVKQHNGRVTYWEHE